MFSALNSDELDIVVLAMQ
jgi:cAMP-dependent protein kinase regulator